jgi:hypothetical protein
MISVIEQCAVISQFSQCRDSRFVICNHHEHSQRDTLNTFITLYLLRIMFPTLMVGYLYSPCRTI